MREVAVTRVVHISDQGSEGTLGGGGVSGGEEDEGPAAEHGGEDTRTRGTAGHCQQVSAKHSMHLGLTGPLGGGACVRANMSWKICYVCFIDT